MSKEDFEGIAMLAKQNHAERVAKTPSRIEYAIKQFELNNIEYLLKSKSNGHFHAFAKDDGLLYQFWASTGKIMRNSKSKKRIHEDMRGIHNFIKLLNGGK